MTMIDPDPYEWPTAVRHNHFTRDIKPEGVCPSCDAFHHHPTAVTEPKHRADVEPETTVAQCCGQVVCCPTCNEPVQA